MTSLPGAVLAIESPDTTREVEAGLTVRSSAFDRDDRSTGMSSAAVPHEAHGQDVGHEEDVPARLFRIVEADRQQPGTRRVGDGSPTPWMRCRVVTIGVALPGTVSVCANATDDQDRQSGRDERAEPNAMKVNSGAAVAPPRGE